MYIVKILFGTIILCSTFHQHQAVFKANEQTEDVDDFLKKVIKSAKFEELAEKIAIKTIDKLKHEDQEIKEEDTINKQKEVTTVIDEGEDKKNLREDQGDRDVEESESVDRDEVVDETTVTTTTAPTPSQGEDEVLRVKRGRTTRNYKLILDKILPSINLNQDFKLNFNRFKKENTHPDNTKRVKQDTVLRADGDNDQLSHSHTNNNVNDVLNEVQSELKFRNNVMKEFNDIPLATTDRAVTLPTRTRPNSSQPPNETPDTSNEEEKKQTDKKESESWDMSNSGEEGEKRDERSGETPLNDGLWLRALNGNPKEGVTSTGVTVTTTRHKDAVREEAGRVYRYVPNNDYQQYHDLYEEQGATNT